MVVVDIDYGSLPFVSGAIHWNQHEPLLPRGREVVV